MRYSKSLVRLAFTYVRCEQDAEDVVQEVFLTWLRAAPTLSGEEHEKAFLIRATINRCKNLLKSRWFRGRRPLTDGLCCLMKEESELLTAVMDLDEKYRLPIHLYYYEGYQIREIAEMLGERPATIGTRLARGREILKTRIGGMLDD
jgi:RNA polymerase sigma-70 factor (ECF subfamily)